MSDAKESPKTNPFEPRSLNSGKVEIKPFMPKSLSGSGISDYSDVKKKFGSLSSLDQQSGGSFNLHPAAKKFLGVERQERDHVEGIVRAEVDARVAEIRESAYREGMELGRKEGLSNAEAEYRESVRPIQEQFLRLLTEFEGIKQELYSANEAYLIQLVYQVGKQVLLQEMGTDREYVKRLAAHVVEKLGAKDNIRIKVSKKDAENIESIKEFLKSTIPDLRNVQIEGSDDLPVGGCKVETDLSRINASVENQLNSIEKSLGAS